MGLKFPAYIFATLLLIGFIGVAGVGMYASYKKTKCPDGTYVLEDGKNYYAVPVVLLNQTLSTLDVEVSENGDKMVVCTEIAGAGRPEDKIDELMCLAVNGKTGKVVTIRIPYKREQHT